MTSNKFFIIFYSILLVCPVTKLLADDSAKPLPYALPQDKSGLESCEQVALKAHPGKVTSFKTHNTADGFHYSFEIEAKDRTDWTVVCQASTGKIIQAQHHE